MRRTDRVRGDFDRGSVNLHIVALKPAQICRSVLATGGQSGHDAVVALVSGIGLLVVLALFAYHRFASNPDSGLASMLLLGLLLSSCVLFAVVETGESWRTAALILQAVLVAAALALHRHRRTVAAWVDRVAPRADAWRPRRGSR